MNYKDILSRIKDFVKRFYDENVYNIMLFIIVCLLIMLAFAVGYIVAKYQSKNPIQIENYQTSK